ncbi:MAG: S8 family serine peptidase, partial [Acidimicrobiia bacterium]
PAAWAAHKKYTDAVVSVGALDTTGPRPRMATFSNRGSWLTAWAPGVDIRSIYPTDLKYEYHDTSGPVGTLDFDGLAEWSGTSFAAPYAAASILAHAAVRDLSPRDAWADMRRGAGFVVL